MYNGEPQTGTDGQSYSINAITKISPSQGIWIYEHCLSIKLKSTLEIGMAYGYSTIYFLAAAAQNQSAHHIAIDPLQTSSWHGIGLANANALAPLYNKKSWFQLIEERSNLMFDLIFIDGNHRFDDVLVDFYL